MLKREEMPEAKLDLLRERIQQDRKTLRARLARPRTKRGAKANARGKLRDIFRQYEGLSDN